MGWSFFYKEEKNGIKNRNQTKRQNAKWNLIFYIFKHKSNLFLLIYIKQTSHVTTQTKYLPGYVNYGTNKSFLHIFPGNERNNSYEVQLLGHLI